MNDEFLNPLKSKPLPGRLFKLDEMETDKVWIAGSKHPSERDFFIQIVTNLKHKQRLWDNWDKGGMHFYFLEIDLPARLNKDETPF